MNELKETYHKAAVTIQRVGQMTLADGRTLSEWLTIQGVSYWKALESTLSVNHLVHHIRQMPEGVTRGSSLSEDVKRRLKAKVLELAMTRFRKASQVLDSSDRTTLLLGFTPYIAKETLLPLFHHLKGQNRLRPVLLSDGRTRRLPSRSSDPAESLSVWSFWNSHLTRQRILILDELKRIKHELRQSGGFKERVQQHFGDMAPSLLDILKTLFDLLLPQMASFHVLADSILSDLQPAVVVSSDVNDPRIRMFVLVAKARGIPSMDLQFSVYDECSVEWLFMETDCLALTGVENQKILRDLGVPSDRMVVTGSARFDNLLLGLDQAAQLVRAAHGIASNQKIVVFASQPNYFGAFSNSELRDRMIDAFCTVFARFPDLTLIVKPHPVEDINEIRELFACLPQVIFAAKQEPIRRYIQAADAFVTFYSSSAYDALALGKPTLGLAFEGSFHSHLIFGGDPHFVGRDVPAIEGFLQSVQEGSNSQSLEAQKTRGKQILDSWFFCSDGQASARIEQLLQRITSGAFY